MSALCAAAVVLFVIVEENAQSIKGSAFVFVLTSSLICPTIFIAANKKMTRHTRKIICQFFADIRVHVNAFTKKVCKRNQVEPTQMAKKSHDNA